MLGFALLLRYLRYPGRVLQEVERPARGVLDFVAKQLGVDARNFGNYAEIDEVRRRHVAEIRSALGLRQFTMPLYR